MAGVQGGLQGNEGCLRSVRGSDEPWARWMPGFLTAGLEELIGMTEPVLAFGARGGRQGWCWHSLLLPAFVLGPKPRTEMEMEGVCVHVGAQHCVCARVCA